MNDTNSMGWFAPALLSALRCTMFAIVTIGLPCYVNVAIVTWLLDRGHMRVRCIESVMSLASTGCLLGARRAEPK